MTPLLKRIIEQQGMESQYYDLGKDFSNFKRTMDGTDEQIKQRFEQAIGAKLNGKRVRAQASRGYKQYIKNYEFDVSKITLDDYYDNYVVVAHDNSTPKAKEYFLKTGFKIQVIGPANGQASTGEEKPAVKNEPVGTAPSSAPVNNPPGESIEKEQEVKEASSGGHYDAYSIDDIERDVEKWLPSVISNPDSAIRDYIKGLGWAKNLGNGRLVAMYDLKIPKESLKPGITSTILQKSIDSKTPRGSKFELVKVEPNKDRDEYYIRIKKTIATDQQI